MFQFFRNGGSTAYVVGLTDPSYVAATASIQSSPPITLTAREPVGTGPGVGIQMQVAITNMQTTTNPDDTADIVITYGTQVETYRKVVIGSLWKTDSSPGGLDGSALVTVTPPFSPPTSYPSGSPAASGVTIQFTYASPPNPSYRACRTCVVFLDLGRKPERRAAEAAQTLPNSRHLVFPGTGHEVALSTSDAAACFLEVMRGFYDNPAEFNDGCIASLRIPPFVTKR